MSEYDEYQQEEEMIELKHNDENAYEEDISEKEKHLFIVDSTLDVSDALDLLVRKKDLHLEPIYNTFSASINLDHNTILYNERNTNNTMEIIPFNSYIFYSFQDVANIDTSTVNLYSKLNDNNSVDTTRVKEKETKESYYKDFIVSKLTEYHVYNEIKELNDYYANIPKSDEDSFYARFDRVSGELYYENSFTNERILAKNDLLSHLPNRELWKIPYKNVPLINMFMGNTDFSMDNVSNSIYSSIYSLSLWIEVSSISLPMNISLYQYLWPAFISSSFPLMPSYAYSINVFISQMATTHISFTIDLQSTASKLLDIALSHINKMKLFFINVTCCVLKIKDKNDYLCFPDIPLIYYTSIQHAFVNNRSISITIESLSLYQFQCLRTYTSYMISHPQVPILISNISQPTIDASLYHNPLMDPTTVDTLSIPYQSYILGNDMKLMKFVDYKEYLYTRSLQESNEVQFSLDICFGNNTIFDVSIGLYESVSPMFIHSSNQYILLTSNIQYNTLNTFYIPVHFPVPISLLPESVCLMITLKSTTLKCIFAACFPLFSSQYTYASGSVALTAMQYPINTSTQTILYNYKTHTEVNNAYSPLQIVLQFPKYAKQIYISKPLLPSVSDLYISYSDVQEANIKDLRTILSYPPSTSLSLIDRRYIYKYKDFLLYSYIPEIYKISEKETSNFMNNSTKSKELFENMNITIDRILGLIYESINFIDINEINEYLNILMHVLSYMFSLSTTTTPLSFITPLVLKPSVSCLSKELHIFTSDYSSMDSKTTLNELNQMDSVSSDYNTSLPNTTVCPPQHNILLLITMLSPRYQYPLVQLLALDYLNTLDDETLQPFLNILIQTLLYQRSLDNSIIRFIISRMLRSPYLIGHSLFWIIRSELRCTPLFPYLYILLSLFIFYGGSYVYEIAKQIAVHDIITELYSTIQIENIETRTKAISTFTNMKSIYLPSIFMLPLSSRYLSKGIRFDKLKIMSSKKAPIRLQFINVYNSENDISVLYKDGDDLRQDNSIITLLSYVSNTLRFNGFTAYVSDYIVVSAEKNRGYIQIVQDSCTLKDLFEERNLYTGAISYDAIDNYLHQNHPSENDYRNACSHFFNSLTVYISLTYLLGIADRHPSNIMIKSYGDIFHIDFGHILGNFKTFAGVKRETQQLVFNPQMLRVLGGEKSETFSIFLNVCSEMFLSIRRNWYSLYSILEVMSLLSLPELSSIQDVNYFFSVLNLSEDNKKSSKLIKDKIVSSMKSVVKRVDDSIHVLAHQNTPTK